MAPPGGNVGHKSLGIARIDDQRWWGSGPLTVLAERQDGLLSIAQLRAAGVPASTWNRWAANGRLRPVQPGVFAVGHRALSERGRRRAALLSAGDDAALGHGTSLAHRGICELHDRRIHVVVPRGSCAPRGEFVLHRAVLLDKHDVETVDGLRTTTVARTLIDLAGRRDNATLGYACRQVEYARKLDVAAIGRTLARMNRQPGTKALRAALGSAGIEGAILETRLEHRGYTALLAVGLPQPITQHWIDLRPDHRRVRVDAWYPDARLVVEIDGPHHRLPLQAADDAARDAALTRRGISVERITDVELDSDPIAAATRALQRWSSNRAIASDP